MQYFNDIIMLSMMTNKTREIETSEDIIFCMFLLGFVAISIIIMMLKLRKN